MGEISVKSSGLFRQYDDGNLVNKVNYQANYDGDTVDLSVKHNDQIYYTEIDDSALMELLNLPSSNKSLIVRLTEEFPLGSQNTKIQKKNKEKSEKKSEKKSKKKNKKKNRESKKSKKD
jgi:hypothetical protein